MNDNLPVRPQARRARHLMDLDAPRPVRSAASAERSLSRVQKWIMSALVLVTVAHLSAGLVVAAIYLDVPTLAAQVGLNLIASGFMVVAVAAALAIHGRPLVSPWLLAGLLPGAVGLWLTLS